MPKRTSFDEWFFAVHGEIRLRRANFTGGWMALGSIFEEDMSELWDFVDDKYNHADAIRNVEANVNLVLILDAPTDVAALGRCLDVFRDMQIASTKSLEVVRINKCIEQHKETLDILSKR